MNAILQQLRSKHQETDRRLNLIKSNICKQAALAIMTIIVGVVLAVSITMAWYTNIAETSSLVFEASAWGLDGQIVVAEEVIEGINPGSEGTMSLTVDNNNDTMVSITVNVSKDSMSEEMQKRIYFYVDAMYSQNDEVMEQVYVTGNSGYIYNIFGNDTLELTDEYSNNSSLQWEWVYDVLGYYIEGTVTESAVVIEEYLQPVVYDFDEAIYDEDGTLLQIDEMTTVEMFLESLTSKDGYEGTLDSTAVSTVNGYYPIDIEEDGTGIWLYLYDLEEIQASWEYDTLVGEQVKSVSTSTEIETSAIAQINVTAQQMNLEGTEVNSATTLRLAIAGDSTVIQLASDITLQETLNIPANKNLIIDLNGHKIIGEESLITPIIEVQEGASLTIIDGSIESEYTDSDQFEESADGYAIKVSAANIILNNVNIVDVYGGIVVADNATYKSFDSSVQIKNSTIDAEFIGVKLFGNGLYSGDMTSLVVENSTINGETYAGILGNGGVDSVDSDGNTVNGYWGTEIQIIDSTITGYYTAMYLPQKSSTTEIYSSVLSGWTGIVIKGGTVDITDSMITGTGTKATAGFASSGWTDTGDAVYIENGYGWDIIVNINEGNTLTSIYGYAIQLYNRDSTYAEYVNITLLDEQYTVQE